MHFALHLHPLIELPWEGDRFHNSCSGDADPLVQQTTALLIVNWLVSCACTTIDHLPLRLRPWNVVSLRFEWAAFMTLRCSLAARIITDREVRRSPVSNSYVEPSNCNIAGHSPVRRPVCPSIRPSVCRVQRQSQLDTRFVTLIRALRPLVIRVIKSSLWCGSEIFDYAWNHFHWWRADWGATAAAAAVRSQSLSTTSVTDKWEWNWLWTCAV